MAVHTSFAGLSFAPFATGTRLVAAIALLTGSALAVDPACKSLADATSKYFTIPTHIYMTATADYTGGKPEESETIYLNDKTYAKVHGRWRLSPVTPKMIQELTSEAKKDAKAGAKDADSPTVATCRLVRDEVVNGEAATLYTEHTETQDSKTDSQCWVSKSRGLPLKIETNEDAGGPGGKRHIVMRFEYTNVQAPAGIH